MGNPGKTAAVLRPRSIGAAAAAACLVLVSGCGSAGSATVIDGRAVSMRYDANRVAGLPVTDGPSGPTVDLPSAEGRVVNTDNGEIDRLTVLAIEDIEDFWQNNYREPLPGRFEKVSELISVDPEASAPEVCGGEPEEFAFNAAYCILDDDIAWDRVGLLPVARKFFGDVSINGLLAHEYGHEVQHKAGLVDQRTPLLVSEQQADCFAGVYLRWVAEGKSPRFSMNTTDGLDKVLAGALAIRDRAPDFNPFGIFTREASHGTALDRVSALQQGFDLGSGSCMRITEAEITERRGNIPPALFKPGGKNSDVPIDQDTVNQVVGVLNRIFSPAQPPAVAFEVTCGSGPAVYCPDTNTVGVDLGQLAELGTHASESQRVLLQGDNSAISVLTSRYMQALQQQHGAALEGQTAAMRTACLTGVAQAKMGDPAVAGKDLVLGPGDLDEAVSGLLTNGLAATDVTGQTVPSGFTRILAFRAGLAGDADFCYGQFP